MAVCNVTDCVPIVEYEAPIIGERTCVYQTGPSELVLHYSDEDAERAGVHILDVSDQLPYGDWEPGRAAWLLDKIVMLDPVPAKGALGLWEWEGAA